MFTPTVRPIILSTLILLFCLGCYSFPIIPLVNFGTVTIYPGQNELLGRRDYWLDARTVSGATSEVTLPSCVDLGQTTSDSALDEAIRRIRANRADGKVP